MLKKLTNIALLVLVFLSTHVSGQSETKRLYSLSSGVSGIYYKGLHGKVQNSQTYNFNYRYEKTGIRKTVFGLNVANTNKEYQSEIAYISASTLIGLNYKLYWQNENTLHGFQLQSNYIINYFPKLNKDFIYWNAMNSIGYSAIHRYDVNNKNLDIEFNISLLSLITESRFKRIVSENDQNSKEPIFSYLGTFPSITNFDIRASYPLYRILKQQFNADLHYTHAQFPSNNGQTLTIIQLTAGVSTRF
jgi:hypothetical protein